MSSTLYPFRFEPIIKEKIWGGTRLETHLGHNLQGMTQCGESWEISGIIGDESVVTNGFLADNNLNELMEIYLTELVGERNYDKYGLGFPLLVKFIDAQSDLSVQVHPDDDLAAKKYGQNGKTEMWHVIDAEPGSGLYVGFNRHVTREQFIAAVKEETISDLLQFYPVQAGDTFMIPAGIVHAIGKGVLLAEIQQPSDITFRIHDWNRTDSNGNPRELHLPEAIEAIHYEENFGTFKVDYKPQKNSTIQLIRSQYFNTSLIDFDQPVSKSYTGIDSFLIYICIEGSAEMVYGDEHQRINVGDVVLVPAEIEELDFIPVHHAKMLETYC